MSAVHTVLQKNAVFHELIRTPLMLSVVLLTYEGKTVKDLPQMGSTEEQQRQVFAHYVERMLERLTRRSNFTPLQTGQWLTWLAQQMQQRHLTEFYLEYLQPAWLPEPFQSIYGVLFYLYVPVVVLLFELLVGLASGIVVKPDGSGMVFYLIIGLAIFCLVDLSPLMTKADANLEIFPVFPLKAAFLRLPSQDRWCWLLFVLIHVLLVGLFFGWGFGMLAGIFSGLLFFGLCVGSLLFIEGGSDLSEVQINERQCNKPNQAIQYSGWSALCIGCGAGLFVMLMSVLLSNGYGNLDLYSIGVLHWKGLRQGLFFGLAGLLFFGQWFGGRAYLQHHTLRFLLWLSGAMPWRSVRFLKEGTEHMLLQRVGGCYRFIHPLFQEYFASLDVTTSTQQTDLPTEQTPESQEQDNPTKRP